MSRGTLNINFTNNPRIGTDNSATVAGQIKAGINIYCQRFTYEDSFVVKPSEEKIETLLSSVISLEADHALTKNNDGNNALKTLETVQKSGSANTYIMDKNQVIVYEVKQVRFTTEICYDCVLLR